MSPELVRDALKQQPFEPFRLVMTDGVGYPVVHPDLLLVGARAVVVGLTGDPGQTYFERTVKVDLLHVVRLEPLDAPTSHQNNGPAAPGAQGS